MSGLGVSVPCLRLYLRRPLVRALQARRGHIAARQDLEEPGSWAYSQVGWVRCWTQYSKVGQREAEGPRGQAVHTTKSTQKRATDTVRRGKEHAARLVDSGLGLGLKH